MTEGAAPTPDTTAPAPSSSRASPAQPTSGLHPPLAQDENQERARPPGQQHKKSKARERRMREEKMRADGTVSDSVVPPPANPQPKKTEKPRQQSAALSVPSAQKTHKNDQKQRPVSVGGNMVQGTPVKEQAYAGPTFQASPAASALPMPKFFSKSVPTVAKHSASLDARMSGQKTPEHESSPEPDVVSPQPPRSAQQSPLDFFFNAQKAENQRKASMHSPELQARHPVPSTEPRNPFQQTGKRIFLNEVDGNGDAMPSPKSMPPNNANREAQNQQLKNLLFNSNNGFASPNATTPPQTQRSASIAQSPGQQLYTPSPSQRSSSGPSTPTPNAEQNNNYSLHYGNRNLSPLFKAARGDTPSRPSNLRQHSSASDSSPATGQPQQHSIDPNSFSRSYLDQHIRASQPSTMPSFPGANGFPQHHKHQHQQAQFYQSPSHHSSASHVQQGVPAAGTSAAPHDGSAGGARDIRSMEDDLRRMLKVDVLGN